MSEQYDVNQPPDFDGVTNMLQDLLQNQTDIIMGIENSSENSKDSFNEIKAIQGKMLAKADDDTGNRFITPELPEKSESKSSSLNLCLILTPVVLIIALAAGVYSFDRLNRLNNELDRKIEKKVDELSTLNQIIDSSKLEVEK